MADRQAMRVDCQDCSFSTVVGPDDDRLPADVLTEHGQETGHRLVVENVEE